ncbi:conditioned medium-induced protein 4 [Halorarius halobius]|uniref:conditioned medium-induced protein 4 n=1 Tax=Halorarius halobius TaxID=2962671 RepID=UPI0020CC63C5|nr:conditioned medium-induced protein 4 [Halorarius halobius]
MTKTDELRTLLERLGGETTFTERQHADAHAAPDERRLAAGLRAVVREMRAEYGFRTSLDDDALVAVVRGFYAGRSDADIAAGLGASEPVVGRARLHLQLVAPADLEGPVDYRALAALRRAGRATADCAAELGVSEAAVRHASRVLDAREAARRRGYRYQLEFESLLDAAGVTAEMSAARRQDRDAFADVFD